MLRRTAVSLLEVAMALAVLAIGLLSVAALLPLGNRQLTEADHLQRVHAVGEADCEELQIRGLVDPNRWLIYTPPPSVPGHGQLPTLAPLPRSHFVPVVIDPLAITHLDNQPLADWPAVYRFPFVHQSGAIYGAPVVLRATLSALPNPSGNMATAAIDRGVAESIFRAREDLLWTTPARPGERPRQLYSTIEGRATQRAYDGRYSWFATVTLPPTSPKPVAPPPAVVSVVVCHRRTLTAEPNAARPAERMVLADLLSGGWGGGDVILRAPSGAGNWLNVKPGEWLMLSGWVVDPAVQPERKRGIVAWYRIRAVDDGRYLGDEFPTRRVTLAGPDWGVYAPTLSETIRQSHFLDADVATVQLTAYATLVDGVAAVFTRTMPRELVTP